MKCEFELNFREYIELCNLLKTVGACETGGHAKTVIADEQVLVDGVVETRKRCKIKKGQTVQFENYTIEVK